MLRFGGFLRNKVLYRQLHQSSILLKAEAFAMPAMSPTMSAGGIVDWKYKVGEPFSAGDVILEVETDKATIDVEAQDDGKFAKILVEKGTKDVPVGQTIAFIAEVDDDLATLELPKETEKKPEPKKETAKTPTASSQLAQTSTPKPAAPAVGSDEAPSKSSKPNPSQTLFPSVLSLLQENHISTQDALENISATGPNGRILKGDVLAYLGKISQDSLNKVTEFIKFHQKLDLSHIELRPAEAATKTGPTAIAPPAKALPLVLSEQISLHVPESVTYEQLSSSIRAYVKECTFLAHEEPLSNEASDLYDPIFEELLVQEPRKPRFKVTYNLVDVEPATHHSFSGHPDIFDILSAGSRDHSQTEPVSTSSQSATRNHEYVLNVSVAVDESLADGKQRAENFIELLSDLELVQNAQK